MKRFILSAFSVLMATAAVAPTAQALPKIDADFNLQTLRLREFDARNRLEAPGQPHYDPESSTPSSSQAVSAEQTSAQTTEPATWDRPAAQEENVSQALSLTEQRHQLLDRS